ncbi:MAG: shikimate kinase [Rhodobacteraceae bacterium]|nr:shikimate kinase [Paracoccaceae bacterium]
MEPQPPVLKRSVVFVGMMGCGKTSVGRAIGKRFRVPFIDTDRWIEQTESMSIVQIFDRFGEDYFRVRERHAIETAIDGPAKSIAIGGGAYIDPENRNFIDRSAVSVWIQADIEVLWQRVRQKASRPLLQTADPYATLQRMAAERTPAYRNARVHVESVNRLPVLGTVERVVTALLEAPPDIGLFETGD